MIEKAVYLSLGSNMGDSKENLIAALNEIISLDGVKLIKLSNLYETKPVGYLNQKNFYNIVVKLSVLSIEAVEFLKLIQNIENKLGRKRNMKWGPRNIDIDILIFGSEKCSFEELTIPHKEMKNRAFVLIPLKEVFDNYLLYDFDFSSMIYQCEDKDGVKIVGDGEFY